MSAARVHQPGQDVDDSELRQPKGHDAWTKPGRGIQDRVRLLLRRQVNKVFPIPNLRRLDSQGDSCPAANLKVMGVSLVSCDGVI